MPIASNVADAGAVDGRANGPEGGLPTAAQIAERAGSIAPGMRESGRVDADAPFERDIVRGPEKDTCARVAFAANARVTLALVDAKGAILADFPSAASGVVGPACVRHTDAIVLRVMPEHDAGVTQVHAAFFVSP